MSNPTAPDLQSIHGHDIIHLIHAQEPAGGFTPAALAAEVCRRFGPEPRFHTCSAGGMTLVQLLDFLASRGKIVERDGRIHTDMSRVCNHGGGEHDHDHEH